jgi:6-phosphogluconolactonase
MPSIRHACVAAILLSSSAPAAEVPVWFGTYTNAKTSSQGIYAARFDTDLGTLTPPVLAASARNPSFLAFHPRLPMLYAVAEMATVEGVPGGAVEAYAIDETTDGLASRGAVSTGGGGPCHVTVDPEGKAVLAANYGGGSVACLGLAEDGRLESLISGAGPSGFLQHALDRSGERGIHPKRQDRPHAHSVDVTPNGRFVIVCDLGLDTIFVHALDAGGATLTPRASTRTRFGAGPRHFALHPQGRFGYGINELDLTVTGFTVDEQAGDLTPLQTLSTLPDESGDRTGFTAAEIAVHPTGRFLYASTRGADTIATYRIDDQTGRLTFIGVEPTRGKTPRHFAIAPGGRFLLAAGQQSDTITVFAIDDESGRLTFTGTSLEVPSPACIAFRP